jgi:hypothetical protein
MIIPVGNSLKLPTHLTFADLKNSSEDLEIKEKQESNLKSLKITPNYTSK